MVNERAISIDIARPLENRTELMNFAERPLTTGQKLVHFAHGALDGEGMPVFVCRISGDWNEHRFRTALAGLQQAHPLLRSRIVEPRPGRPMLQLDPNPPSIPLTVIRSKAEQDWELAAVGNCLQPVAADQTPLCRIIVLTSDLDESFDVIFVMHHAIIDGVSFLAMLRELLERLAGRTGPSGVEDVEFDQSAQFATTFWERWQALAQLFRTRWKFRRDRIGVVREEIPAPGSILRQVWPEDTTSALVQKCREERTTVLGAVLAAAMHTLTEDQDWGDATQQIHVPVNLRNAHVPPIDDDVLGCYASRINLWQPAPKSLTLWELARRYRQDIQRDLDDRLPIRRDELLANCVCVPACYETPARRRCASTTWGSGVPPMPCPGDWRSSRGSATPARSAPTSDCT